MDKHKLGGDIISPSMSSVTVSPRACKSGMYSKHRGEVCQQLSVIGDNQVQSTPH